MHISNTSDDNVKTAIWYLNGRKNDDIKASNAPPANHIDTNCRVANSAMAIITHIMSHIKDIYVINILFFLLSDDFSISYLLNLIKLFDLYLTEK